MQADVPPAVIEELREGDLSPIPDWQEVLPIEDISAANQQDEFAYGADLTTYYNTPTGSQHGYPAGEQTHLGSAGYPSTDGTSDNMDLRTTIIDDLDFEDTMVQPLDAAYGSELPEELEDELEDALSEALEMDLADTMRPAGMTAAELEEAALSGGYNSYPTGGGYNSYPTGGGYNSYPTATDAGYQ